MTILKYISSKLVSMHLHPIKGRTNSKLMLEVNYFHIILLVIPTFPEQSFPTGIQTKILYAFYIMVLHTLKQSLK